MIPLHRFQNPKFNGIKGDKEIYKKGIFNSSQLNPELTSKINASNKRRGNLLPNDYHFWGNHLGYDFRKVRVHNSKKPGKIGNNIIDGPLPNNKNIDFTRNQNFPGFNKEMEVRVYGWSPMVLSQSSRKVSEKKIMRKENSSDKQKSINTDKTCKDFHRCEIIEPMKIARQMIRKVLNELGPVASGTITSGRIINLLNVHFHTSTQKDVIKILANFQLIQNELNSNIKFNCSTTDPNACKSEKGFVAAETNCSSGSDILLCGTYFVGLDCKEQARVLIHENAHHLPNLCNDHAYVQEPKYMTLSSDVAMKNPDTYAQFSKMVFRGAASCPDCGLEIIKNPDKYKN